MQNGMETKERRGLLADGVLIFLLCGLAFAQPLYDVLSRGAEFFVARRSQPIDVLFMVATLSLGLPCALLAIMALVDLVGRKAREALHAAVACVLFSIALLPVLKQVQLKSAAVVLLAAGVLGTICGLVSVRWRVLRSRSFLIPASLVVIFLPLWFLLATPVRKVIAQDLSVPRTGAGAQLRTPVFLIVLDELPTTTLMNGEREIDGGFFPGIHALAADSTWYRNATTVADYTELAVPAILTGRYPDQRLLPTSADYPDNLFTLFGGKNDLVVTERTTELCPPEICRGQNRVESFSDRLRALFSDLAVVYGHAVLPGELTENRLPPVSGTWSGFATTEASEGEVEGLANKAAGRVSIVESFIRSIRQTRRPALYYVHAGLPHHPWLYTPTGKRYAFRRAQHLRGFSVGKWGADTWHSAQGFQRHVMQTMFADKLVAEMLRRLKELTLYDRSLIILTSDHGVSFRPGAARRKLSATNYADVMPVPLLVKLPHQRKGHISDSNVEVVDILPTIAEVQGVEIPWQVDGRVLGSRSQADRGRKTVFSKAGDKLTFSADFDEKYDALEWKSGIMGAAAGPMGLYGIGPYKPYEKLIGQRTTTNGPTTRLKGTLDSPDLFKKVFPEGSVIPSLVAGYLYREEKADHHYLAVAVNGIVRAVTRTYREDTVHRFSALVPEESFRPGSNNVEIFAIREDPGGTPRLSRVPIGDSPYSIERAAGPESEVIRSADGGTFSVESHQIDGRVHRGVVRDDVIMIRGWAADVEEAEPPAVILVFENGEFRFSGTAGRARRGRGRGPAIKGASFELTIPKSVFSDLESAELRFFAVSNRGYASELRTSRNFRWRKKSPGVDEETP